MLKVEQAAIVQAANVNVINIRAAEINYFGNFFSSFGTQAAVISGIIVNSVSQVPGLTAECNIVWVWLYWITSALTFITSMQVLISSVFISVYGQGLALRGPVGSMVRAVDGMIIEQENVVGTFCLSIFFLALNLIGTYGIFMNFITAVISSIITIVGMYVWYLYCIRLYNRFKFSASHIWTSDIHSDPNNLRRSLPKSSTQPITMQGYLTIVEKRSKLLQSDLSRKYFVLHISHMDFYSDQRSFELNPIKPLNTREIELQGYQVRTKVTDTAFTLFLIPNNSLENLKEWQLRCDTNVEMLEWSKAFTEAIERADKEDELT